MASLARLEDVGRFRRHGNPCAEWKLRNQCTRVKRFGESETHFGIGNTRCVISTAVAVSIRLRDRKGKLFAPPGKGKLPVLGQRREASWVKVIG